MSANDVVQYLMRQKSKSLSSAFTYLCPAFHSTAVESSTHAPVRIEVEADETTYGLFWILHILSATFYTSLFAHQTIYGLLDP